MVTGWRRRCAWGGVALVLLLPSCAGEAGPATGCHGGWRVQTGPAGARESNELFGVSAASSRGVWAVGVTLPSGGPARTLVERWQGRAWRTVPSPDRLSGGNFLNAVVALSASDAWAVGLSRSPGGPARTLILHWDGRRWAIAASPNAGPGGNFLVSVAAASARDVWAATPFSVAPCRLVGAGTADQLRPSSRSTSGWDGPRAVADPPTAHTTSEAPASTAFSPLPGPPSRGSRAIVQRSPSQCSTSDR